MQTTNNGSANGSNFRFLHLEDVYKSYDRVILDDIDLSVSKGEFCTVVGPSGCGKSTLLRLILGVESPDSGTLHLRGNEIGYPSPSRGIVFQRYSLYPHLTVLENVMLGRTLPTSFFERRSKKKEFIEEAEYYLKRVRLEGQGDKYPHELSGGMQQRVAIAQSLLTSPDILLMDEPFGALDPDTREEMQLFLLELWDDQKMTVFFVTHDLEEAFFLGTRVLVLSQYYTDGRGDNHEKRGAKIVGDYPLEKAGIYSTKIKNNPDFIQLTEEIRSVGFDPKIRQHVNEFNLKHPDSFRTLTQEEAGS
ncbi:MAG: ABC transporter ATP-binding protein [Gammaproteobacteria bacterium]|nr:MAG: ABC transporter ATP-binding protein [Gammaproteobacteria bacterium]